MIRCFWIEPMGLAQVKLRRFTFGTNRMCAANGKWGCDASVLVEPVKVPIVWMMDGERIGGYGRSPRRSRSDPRWPTACATCNRPFQPEDEWQRHVDQLYTDGNGGRWTLQTWKDEPPPGAMWHAWWHDEHWPGPDGRCIAVMTPAGSWDIDGPDMHGNRCWTRSGNPPDLVVTPSIVIGDKYHGWLGNGGAPPGYLKPC